VAPPAPNLVPKVIKQRSPRVATGWVDRGLNLAKLKNASNLGNDGVCTLFTPAAEYFLRGARKQSASIPEVFEKELFMIAAGNLYQPSREEPEATANKWIAYERCSKLLKADDQFLIALLGGIFG
jgi:hypothetical protein